MKQYFGKPIDPVTKDLRYTSPSQIKLFNACNAKWYFQYILGRKPDKSAWQVTGDAVDVEIKQHLLEGSDLGPRTLVGLSHMPTGEVYCDIPIARVLYDNIQGVVFADDVAVIGEIDILQLRMIIDIKTTRDVKWIKTPAELAEDPQMLAYALYNWATFKHDDPLVLRHWYFLTKGKARSELSEVTVTKAQAQIAWSKHEESVAKMKATAKLPTVDDAHANVNDCNSYGGCPHRSYCKTYSKHLLEMVANAPLKQTESSLEQQLLNSIAIKSRDKNMLTPNQNTLLSRFKTAESSENGDVAKVLYLMSKIGEYSEFGDALLPMAGPLAGLRARGKNETVTEYEGTGNFAKGFNSLTTLQEFKQFCEELGMPPDVLAYDPPPFEANPPIRKEPIAARELPAMHDPGVLPPDAPSQKNEVTIIEQPDVVQKRKPGRPKLSQLTAPAAPQSAPVTVAQAPVPLAQAYTPPTQPATPTPAVFEVVTPVVTPSAPQITQNGFNLYINCMPLHASVNNVQSLAPYVYTLVQALNQLADVPDIRMASEKSAFAYGKWKGVLTALAVEKKPPNGDYFIAVRENEYAEIVAQALTPFAAQVFRGVW